MADAVVESEPARSVIIEFELRSAEHQHVADKDHVPFWDSPLSQVVQQLLHDGVRKCAFDIEKERGDHLLAAPSSLDCVHK